MRRLQPVMGDKVDDSQGGVLNTKPIHVLLTNLREVIQTYLHKMTPNFILLSIDFYKALPLR